MGKIALGFLMGLVMVATFAMTPAPADAHHGPLSFLGNEVVGRIVGGGVGVITGGTTFIATGGDVDVAGDVFNDTYRGIGGFVGWMISMPERLGESIIEAIDMMRRGEGDPNGPPPAPEHPGL